MVGLSQHILSRPPQDDGGLGKLLRRGGAPAGVQVDCIRGRRLEGGLLLLPHGEQVQNHIRHGKDLLMVQ